MNQQQWRPIETAPTDGTWVLICGPRVKPVEGYFRSDHEPGWTRTAFRDVPLNVTHWMPLPDPPQFPDASPAIAPKASQ